MERLTARDLKQRSPGGGSLAEFGPVLGVVFVVVLLPLIGLFSFVDGVATVYFAAGAAARAAAPALTLGNAVLNAKATGGQILSGPFGAFANITPRSADGLTLAVVQIPLSAAAGASQGGGGVEQPFNNQVNTDQYIYEYRVTASYSLGPLFVPGGPFPMQFVAACSVEHPEGLNSP